MKTMNKVVFVSNFFNHHQKPFSDAMFSQLGAGYLFLETSVMGQEQINLGWEMNQYPEYVVPSFLVQNDVKKYENIIFEADAVIFGSAPYELVKRRIRANKLTFRYSERPLKKGLQIWRYPDRFVRWRWQWPQNKNVYLLCASAYAAEDFAKFGMFRNRAFKWGYFPQTYHYEDIDALIEKKTKNSLVWVARYIDWKHPEIGVEIGKRLKNDGYDFEINMIGNGQLMEATEQAIRAAGLEQQVHILGAMKPEEVRAHMEKAQIHIFTSDRNEGWGAVLNESMNSACVPVANREIGAAPFLIENGKNGYLYSDIDELYEKVKYMLDHPQERMEMAKCAYDTIVKEWNAEVAAERFLELANNCLAEKGNTQVFEKGVCSKDQ